MNIYLIGYRGTGKSTIAPALALRLGGVWQWVDLDVEIEKRAGRTIADIFANDGEPTFRDREAEALASHADQDHFVVATGGGAILRPSNREVMKQGFVVWLDASLDTIERRLLEDPTTATRRPNLSVGGRTEIEHILRARLPIYQQMANLRIPSDTQTVAEIVETIVQAIGEKGRLP